MPLSRLLPVLALVLVLCTSLVWSGCAESSRSPATDAHAGMAHDLTPGGTPFMAPVEVTAEPGWPDAIREIDTAVRGFESGLGGRRLTVTSIDFHALVMDPEVSAATRACFVGDGRIEACYHAEQVPHTFCLSEAIRDLAAAQYPEVPAWQLDWAEDVSASWVAALYGQAARLD